VTTHRRAGTDAQADDGELNAASPIAGAPEQTVGIQPREPQPDPAFEAARSPEEAEERYVAARDAWAAAMRAANSGRPADLATLAVAQEAYEAAAAEREQWASGARVAIPVGPDPNRAMDAIVGQQLAWRRVHEAEPPKRGVLGRLTRKIRGR
jgi:hypothetical protein